MTYKQKRERSKKESILKIYRGMRVYAMVCTRPDVAYVVGVVSQFMSYLEEAH